MKTTTANYDTENAKENKQPAAIVDLDNLSRRYYAPDFGNNGANDKNYLKSVTLNAESADLLSSPVLLGDNIEFEVLDESQDVTGIIQNNSLVGETFTPSVGFQSLDDTDFVNFPAQTIEPPIIYEGQSWTFSTKDARALLNGKIFKNLPQDAANEAIDASETDIDVDDGTVFIDPANFTSTDWTTGKIATRIVIEDEECQVSSISGNTITVSSRGTVGSATTHDNGVVITQVVVFQNWQWNELLLAVLLTTDDGTGHSFYDLASYDSNLGGFGLGLSESDINIEEIERLAYKLFHFQDRTVSGKIDGPVEALKWIEDYILKPFGLFMYKDGDGKITVDSFNYIHFVDGFSSTVTFDDDAIKDGARFEERTDKLINNIVVRYKDNDQQAKFCDVNLDESITDYGEQSFEIEVPWGSTAGTESDQYKQYWAMTWLYFWGNAPGTVKLPTRWKHYISEKGDYCQVTWPYFPELQDGTLGWTTKKAIILGQKARFDFTNGRFSNEFELLTWELYDRVASFTTTNTYDGGDLDSTTLDFSTDAHDEIPVQETPDAITVTIQVTPPGTTSDSHEWFDITCKGQEDDGMGGFNDRSDVTVRCRYYTDNSTAWNLKIMWPHGDSTNNNLDRILVQYVARSTSGADEASFVLTETQTITFDQSMTVN